MSDPMRKAYRQLDADEAAAMHAVKDAGEKLIQVIGDSPVEPRMAALARTNCEQAVMWAVKGITG